MASYFRQVPDFQYVSRLPDSQSISDYITVKNLFKRGKLREDIFGNIQFFTKYKIIGNERPDNVAYKVYNDETLDWVILLSNNILNVQTEWPLSQQGFDNFLLEKYGSYDQINAIHHYETNEIKNTNGITIIPAGLQVPSNFTTTYYDTVLGRQVTQTNFTKAVTNFDYEQKLQDDRRNIFVLKPTYLNVVFNDMDEIMPYKKGSQQYVTENLKKGDNIRLYT
jgi:hypothetical protein